MIGRACSLGHTSYTLHEVDAGVTSKKQAAPMQDPDRAALQAAVELLHNCQATFLRTECVRVTSGSVTIEREVAIFTLRGRDLPAPLAYAWMDFNSAQPDRARHQVVLHRSVVKSPEHAVAGFYLAPAGAHAQYIAPNNVVIPYPEY
jgi:hypothetical protein